MGETGTLTDNSLLAQPPDNFIYLIFVDQIEHTSELPFCWDRTCPDKEDQEEIARVFQWVQDGLMPPQEATDFINGRMV